jgi:hypothetical protein
MSPIWKELGRITCRTVFYFILLVAIILLWQGRGLFIYENF